MATGALHTLIDVNLAGLTCEDKIQLVTLLLSSDLCPESLGNRRLQSQDGKGHSSLSSAFRTSQSR